MTDHLHEARERLTRGEYRSAHTNALIALAEELRRFNDRAERDENAPAPLEVATLSHPSCRSSQWIDAAGDRWAFRDGQWHFYRDRSRSWIAMPPDVCHGPYRRVLS